MKVFNEATLFSRPAVYADDAGLRLLSTCPYSQVEPATVQLVHGIVRVHLSYWYELLQAINGNLLFINYLAIPTTFAAGRFV